MSPIRAIVHVDADSFFASCEVAKEPKLKGMPVATGMERGIISSLTYEAKALGVKRAMSVFEAKKICPNLIFLPSDYETYSLYSCRMFEIVRRYTDKVEEYSIDECFADLSGFDKVYKMSYEEIVASIKNDLDNELGFTFSIGLASTKVLAKIASKWQKPSGLTIINDSNVKNILSDLDISSVWGIGPQTSFKLNKLGVFKAIDFANKSYDYVKLNLDKPYFEIWKELNEEMVFQLKINQKTSYGSISKTKTFTPPRNDRDYVFSQLSKNIENACIKLRRYNLITKKISFFLKDSDFRFHSFDCVLERPTNSPIEIIEVVDSNFHKVFNDYYLYRSSGIVLNSLIRKTSYQSDIFNHVQKSEKISEIFSGVDSISKKYGKHSLFLGSSLKAMSISSHQNNRNKKSARYEDLFKGESKRKRLKIPYLGLVK